MTSLIPSVLFAQQEAMAARLSLNCSRSYVQPQEVNDLPTTIISVWDHSALSQDVKDDVCKCYPNAKLGHLKTGGNFPFLSRSEEFNLFVTVSILDFFP